jgi:beta-1,4-mannosyltransferase
VEKSSVHIHYDIYQHKTLPLTEVGIQKQTWTLHTWLYRCRLIISTLAICWLLFLIQKALNPEPLHVSQWQTVTRWSEVVWIIPAPVAATFWIGWLLFAQFAKPDPRPVPVPSIAINRDGGSRLEQVCLVFRFVTRGDNLDVLRSSIQAVHEAFARYPLRSGPYRVEVVSERPLNLVGVTRGRTFVYAVPRAYVTINRSRFKARAMTYLQTQTDPQPQDWHIYMDEESMIDDVFIAGIYRFIMQSQQRMCQPGQRCKGYIGQGTIIYQGGHWFFRTADAIRTADDLGRFHLQYRLGVPIFGMHGSFIVVRGIDDAHLTFDVGPRNSIAEDTAWALRAWANGYRFAWVDGYLYEQPPQKVKEFIKQRSRWLIGIRLVLQDKTIPLRCKWCLGIFTYSWHLSLLPLLVAIMALFTHTNAFLWVQIPANFAWTVFFLSYVQGASTQMRRTIRFFTHEQSSLLLDGLMHAIAYPLALGIFWYTLLESASIFYSTIRPQQGFFVIRKPVLHHRKEAVS